MWCINTYTLKLHKYKIYVCAMSVCDSFLMLKMANGYFPRVVFFVPWDMLQTDNEHMQLVRETCFVVKKNILKVRVSKYYQSINYVIFWYKITYHSRLFLCEWEICKSVL